MSRRFIHRKLARLKFILDKVQWFEKKIWKVRSRKVSLLVYKHSSFSTFCLLVNFVCLKSFSLPLISRWKLAILSFALLKQYELSLFDTMARNSTQALLKLLKLEFVLFLLCFWRRTGFDIYLPSCEFVECLPVFIIGILFKFALQGGWTDLLLIFFVVYSSSCRLFLFIGF